MSNALATRRVPMSHSRGVDEFQTNKSTTVHMTRQLHSTVTRKHSCTKTKKKKRTAQYSCIPRSQDSTKKCILAPFFPLGLVPPSRSKWGSATEDRALAFCWQCELSSNESRTVSRDQEIRGCAQGTWLAAMSDALATSSQLLFGRTLRRAGMSDALATGSQLLSGRTLRRDFRREAILRAMSLRGWPPPGCGWMARATFLLPAVGCCPVKRCVEIADAAKVWIARVGIQTEGWT